MTVPLNARIARFAVSVLRHSRPVNWASGKTGRQLDAEGRKTSAASGFFTKPAYDRNQKATFIETSSYKQLRLDPRAPATKGLSENLTKSSKSSGFT